MTATLAQRRALCNSIADCTIARAILETSPLDLPEATLRCVPIVSSQLLAAAQARPDIRPLPWLLPEPWNGHLHTAPILFIGQNPSADHDECYPTLQALLADDGPDAVHRFFEQRFDGSEPAIKDGTRVRRADDTWPPSGNKFLGKVRRIAELLTPEGVTLRPGIHYALAEAVRCKSRDAEGVERAALTCAPLHLAPTLALSGARVIVCLGGLARQAFLRATEQPRHAELPVIEWNGRLVAFVDHPGAFGRRGHDDPAPEILARLREALPVERFDEAARPDTPNST